MWAAILCEIYWRLARFRHLVVSAVPCTGCGEQNGICKAHPPTPTHHDLASTYPHSKLIHTTPSTALSHLIHLHCTPSLPPILGAPPASVSIESTGILPPAQLFEQAIQILASKCDAVLASLANCDQGDA